MKKPPGGLAAAIPTQQGAPAPPYGAAVRVQLTKQHAKADASSDLGDENAAPPTIPKAHAVTPPMKAAKSSTTGNVMHTTAASKVPARFARALGQDQGGATTGASGAAGAPPLPKPMSQVMQTQHSPPPKAKPVMKKQAPAKGTGRR